MNLMFFDNKFSPKFNLLPGKGAERFLDFIWPTWDGQIPTENHIAIFQGLIRGTKAQREKNSMLGMKFVKVLNLKNIY